MGAIMYKGDPRSNMVSSWQQALITILGQSALPKYGADGAFGDETLAATKVYQKKLGFSGSWIDGKVGPKTFQAHLYANPNVAMNFTLADVTPPGYVNKIPAVVVGSPAAVIAKTVPKAVPGPTGQIEAGGFSPSQKATTPWTMFLAAAALFLFLKKKKRK